MELVVNMVLEAQNNQMIDGIYQTAGRLLIEGAKKIEHLERRIEELEARLTILREEARRLAELLQLTDGSERMRGAGKE